MGRASLEIDTISATDVLETFKASLNHGWDKSLAKKGTDEHTRIFNLLNEQMNLMLFDYEDEKTKIEIDHGQILGKGRTLKASIDNTLTLHVIPDAVIAHDNSLTCVEIKKSFYHLDLLQLLYGCIAANETYSNNSGGAIQGILYLYGGQESVRILDDGGRSQWDNALRIARLAYEITLGKESNLIKTYDIPVQDYRERAVVNRREMDGLWDSMVPILRQSLT